MSKILEKIINSRLVTYLETHSFLSSNQYGFRRNLSTNDAVHNLVDHVVKKLDKSHKCIALFLDLAKAFDTVSIPMLIDKLETLGVRGVQLSLFQSYLTKRTQSVKIGSYTSSELPIEYGVPQGSILGPTLFLVYINDLCNLTLQGGNIFSYADDTALIFSSNTWLDTYRFAQTGFDTVREWLNNNLLTLNTSKTKLLNFSIRNLSNSLDSSLQISAKPLHAANNDSSVMAIERVTSVKYLGVVIDSNLTFKEHTETLSKRVRKLIYIFKQLRQSADADVMKMVYLALGQSILSYCSITWGGAAKSNLIKVERAQRAVLKVCCFKPRLFPTAQLYEFCQVPTVRQLFIIATTMKQHSVTPFNRNSTTRNHLVATSTPLRTFFSRRFFVFLGPYLYNKLHKLLSIHHLNRRLYKTTLLNWLLTQSYSQTEALLEVPQ